MLLPININMGIKISQLPSTTTYDGNELIAIVQNGATRRGSLKSLVPILSVGISLKDVTELKALSGNWQKAYTTSTAYQASSATFAPRSLVQSTSALLLTRSDYSTTSATSENTVNTLVQSTSALLLTRSDYNTSSATFAPNSLVQSTSALLLTRSDYSTSSATLAPITIVRSLSNTYSYVDATSSIRPTNGNNTAGGIYSNVAGGYGNTASGFYSNVAGGCSNLASGNYSNVAGWRSMTASGF